MANVFLGTELKLSISVDPIQGYRMVDYDCSVDIYCTPAKVVSLPKSQLINIDDDTYVARVDTKDLGVGRVKCRISAYIPDGDFEGDKRRTEVCIVDPDINIIG